MPLTEKQGRQLENMGMEDVFFKDTGGWNPVEMWNERILFIGLGGKGVRTVSAIKKELGRKIFPEEDRKTDTVKFLAIDTDRRDLLEACEGNGLDRTQETFLLPTPDSLKFARKIVEALLVKLSSLTDGRAPLIVYVLAGLCGDTGSRALTDITYLVRHVCEQCGLPVKVEGYVFLPDVYPPEIRRPYMESNAYAAMKELDYYMNLSAYQDRSFDAVYKDGLVHSREDIFDICTLIGGSFWGGRGTEHPDKFAEQVAVDHIVSLITAGMTREIPVISYFRERQGMWIADSISKLPEDIPRDANYCYNVTGIGTVSVPVEQMLSYLAMHAFKRISGIWERRASHLDAENVECLLRELRVDPNVQLGDILDLCHFPSMAEQMKEKLSDFSRSDAVSGQALGRIHCIWEAYMSQWSMVLKDAAERNLRRMQDTFDQRIGEMLADPDRGPIYTEELLAQILSETETQKGFLLRLKEIYGEACGLENNVRASFENGMRELEDEICTVGNSFTIFMSTAKKRVVEKAAQWGELGLQIEVCELIKYNLNEFTEHANQKLHYCRCLADSFRSAGRGFINNYEKISQNKDLAECRVSLLDLNGQDEVAQRCREYLDQKLSDSGIDSMADRLHGVMRENEKVLTDIGAGDPAEVYTRFVKDEFREISGMTMEDFIRIGYGKENLDTAAEQILERLEAAAGICFDPEPRFPLGVMNRGSWIVVPPVSGELRASVNRLARQKGTTVTESTDRKRIIWYNLICGVPLFALKNLRQYEESYEKLHEKSDCAADIYAEECGKRDVRKLPGLSRLP